jgi:hypothetical protein
MKAKKAAAKQEWLDKVVVETTSFRPFASSDNVRTERLKGMLRGDAKKDYLQFIQRGGMTRGHAVPPLSPAPISMALTDPWIDPRSVKSPFRADAPGETMKPFLTAPVPPALQNSRVHMPLRTAGMSISAPIGTIPTISTHKFGINTDAI